LKESNMLNNKKPKRILIPVLILLCLVFAAFAVFFAVKNNTQNKNVSVHISEITQLKEENEGLHQQLQDLNTRYEQLENENKNLISNLKSKSSDLAEKQKEVNELQQEITTLKNPPTKRNVFSRMWRSLTN